MNPFKAIAIRLRDEGLAGLFPTKNRTSLRDLHPDNITSNTSEIPTYETSYGVQPSEPWPRTDGPTPGIPYPGDEATTSINPDVPGAIQREAFRQAAINHYAEEGRSPEEAGRLAAQRLQERFGTLAEQQRIRDAYAGPPMPPVAPPLRTLGGGASITREHPSLQSNPYSSRTPMLQPLNPNRVQGDPMALSHFVGAGLREPDVRLCGGCAHEATMNNYCGSCNVGHVDPERDKSLSIIDRYISKDNQDYLYNEWKKKVSVKLKEQARQEILDEMKNEKKIFKRPAIRRIAQGM